MAIEQKAKGAVQVAANPHGKAKGAVQVKYSAAPPLGVISDIYYKTLLSTGGT